MENIEQFKLRDHLSDLTRGMPIKISGLKYSSGRVKGCDTLEEIKIWERDNKRSRFLLLGSATGKREFRNVETPRGSAALPFVSWVYYRVFLGPTIHATGCTKREAWDVAKAFLNASVLPSSITIYEVRREDAEVDRVDYAKIVWPQTSIGDLISDDDLRAE